LCNKKGVSLLWLERSPRSRWTWFRFPGRVRPKYLKSWYSQLLCLMFSKKGLVWR